MREGGYPIVVVTYSYSMDDGGRHVAEDTSRFQRSSSQGEFTVHPCLSKTTRGVSMP